MYNDYILDYVTKLMSSEKAQLLDEKLIMFNQGKNYGQVVFMAGGAGSGKDLLKVISWKRINSRLEMLMNGKKHS